MKSFPNQKNTTIAKQLLRSATSIGANINEAVFIHIPSLKGMSIELMNKLIKIFNDICSN